MKRYWYAKCTVTLLASTLVTFHFLHSKISDENETFPGSDPMTFDDSRSYVRRKLSQGDPKSPAWVVLPGQVTVHEGEESVPLNFSFELKAEKICDTFDPSRRSLLIFIASRVNHFSQRKVIRETWGLKLLQDAYNYRVVFLIGEADEKTRFLVLHEGYRYGDLVQINLTESFRSLGAKSVAGIYWTKLHCGAADFVMKTDDDILVHVPNLLDALDRVQSPDSLLMCHENRMRNILRKDLLDRFLPILPTSYRKYEVSEKELPGEYYPPYCSGMAYVFSGAVRDRLLEASRATPVFFIEDVYLTGFCRHKAGILITPHAGITLRPPVDGPQAACAFRDGRITSQEVGTDELRLLWAELNTQGFFCPEVVGYARRE